MVLNTYNKYSKSYKKLKSLGISRLPFIINWGNAGKNYGMNNSESVKLATNKKSMLLTLDANEIPTLEWTDDYETAMENVPVYCRVELCGSKGRGITRANLQEDVVGNCPLYTVALDGYDEYRIHVMNGRVFYAQKKVPRYNYPDTIVKNLKDYYFSKLDINRLHPRMPTIATDTIKALGLSFGAVDIFRKKNDLRVLEVNTAPGLDNSTARAYSVAFRRLL